MYQRLRIVFLFCSVYGTLVLGSLAGDAYKHIMRLAEIAENPEIGENRNIVIQNPHYRGQIQRCVEVARQLAQEISPTQIDIPALDDSGSNRERVVHQLAAVARSLQCADDDYTGKLIQNGLNVLQQIVTGLPKYALQKFRHSETALNRHHVRRIMVKDLRSSVRATLDTMIEEQPILPQKPGFEDNYDITANHSEAIQAQINMAIGLAKDSFPYRDIQAQVPQFIELSETSRQDLNTNLLEIGSMLQNIRGVLGRELGVVFEPLALIVMGRFRVAKTKLDLSEEGQHSTE
jgi:hypothetical protein